MDFLPQLHEQIRCNLNLLLDVLSACLMFPPALAYMHTTCDHIWLPRVVRITQTAPLVQFGQRPGCDWIGVNHYSR